MADELVTRQGWSFLRLDDGSVRVVAKWSEMGTTAFTEDYTPQEWAHILAHVSKSGPIQMAKDVAAEFHSTNFGEFEESASVQETA